MFHYIKGNVTMRIDGGVVIEAGGIGYKVYVPDNSPVYLYNAEDTALIYTAVIIREDDVSIYGFSDRESLDMFNRLITVSGVGAKMAMSILSALTVRDIKRAIVFGDAALLSGANGVGKKTAQRIILELKDKVDPQGVVPDEASGAGMPVSAAPAESGERETAVNALMKLGYSRAEAASAVKAVAEDGLDAPAYIRLALKNLF